VRPASAATPVGPVGRLTRATWCSPLQLMHNSMDASLLPHVGAAPLPGSTQVLDRQTGKLAPCTKLLCPTADQVRGECVLGVSLAPGR
jgi:hypothetical protein